MLSIVHRRHVAAALASVLAAATLSINLVAPAAAREVSHSSFQSRVAQVVWGQVDLETGAGTWGIVAAFDQDDFDGISLFEQTAVAVDCGEYSSLSGTFRMGDDFAPAELEVARNLSSASAAGTMTIITGTFDGCLELWEVTSVEEGVGVSLELVATGSRDNVTDRYLESLPGEYRAMQVNRTQSRAASGSVLVGGEAVAFEQALISKHAGSFHFIGH
jgi:hypothetical protein